MGTDSEAMALVHLIRRLSVRLHLLGAEFGARNDLHATDVRALIELLDAVRADVTASPGWLGARLGLNSAATTALIDRLERLGLVRRERNTADRRRVRLVVSPAANRLGWSFFGPIIDRMVAAMADFTPEERETAYRFLTAMTEAVTVPAPSPTPPASAPSSRPSTRQRR